MRYSGVYIEYIYIYSCERSARSASNTKSASAIFHILYYIIRRSSFFQAIARNTKTPPDPGVASNYSSNSLAGTLWIIQRGQQKKDKQRSPLSCVLSAQYCARIKDTARSRDGHIYSNSPRTHEVPWGQRTDTRKYPITINYFVLFISTVFSRAVTWLTTSRRLLILILLAGINTWPLIVAQVGINSSCLR